MNEQTELCLPRRDYREDEREQLAATVADLNAEQDPAERCRLFAEVQRLRAAVAESDGRCE